MVEVEVLVTYIMFLSNLIFRSQSRGRLRLIGYSPGIFKSLDITPSSIRNLCHKETKSFRNGQYPK